MARSKITPKRMSCNGRSLTQFARGSSVSNPSSETSSDSYDAETHGEWEVDAVLGGKIDRFGTRHALIKWKGWQGEPTWEPEANLNCAAEIKKFLENFADLVDPRSSGCGAISAGAAWLYAKEEQAKRRSQPRARVVYSPVNHRPTRSKEQFD